MVTKMSHGVIHISADVGGEQGKLNQLLMFYQMYSLVVVDMFDVSHYSSEKSSRCIKYFTIWATMQHVVDQHQTNYIPHYNYNNNSIISSAPFVM